jgi:hypothetical protein
VKQDIRPVEPDEITAAFGGLRPVRFRWRKPSMGDKLEYGFIVDDMRDVPALDPVVRIGEGRMQSGDTASASYSMNQVLAITVARLKQLEAEIAKLRSQLNKEN